MWEKRKKLHKFFGIVKYGQLRKLLGVWCEWKIFELGEIYVVMSMNDKVWENIKHYENYTGNTRNNYISTGAPGTTLQNNYGETINMNKYSSLVRQTMFYGTKTSSGMHLCERSISKACAESRMKTLEIDGKICNI